MPPTGSETADSGHTGQFSVAEERIAAGPEPVQDVLFVIDNSCSMAQDQSQMDVDSWAFFQHLSGSSVDWHVGVTSTDIGRGDSMCRSEDPLGGRLVELNGVSWIDATVARPEVDFGRRIALGTSGSSCEMGIAAAYLALGDRASPGFLREGSAVHVIVVSDEQDQSEEWGANVVTLDGFEDWFTTLRPFTTFSSFVCTKAFGGYGDCPPENVGSRYLQLTENVGGLVWDIISNAEYVDPFDELGGVMVAPRATYALEGVPDPVTIDVELDRGGVITAVDPSDYSYDAVANTLVFARPLQTLLNGDVIVVHYTPAP